MATNENRYNRCADGPTSIFVATNSYSGAVAFIIALIAFAGIIYLVFDKIRKW